jgi:PKD repeat protein
MRRGMKRGALLILAVLAAAACDKSEAPTRDAGEDLVPSDTPPPPSDVPVSLAVDFAVENCPSFDPIALTCTGSVPLAVRFVPLATTTVTNYRWEFGDGSLSASEAAPSHVYGRPGTYTVKIIATDVGGGLVTKVHTGFIVAQANAIGEPCDASVQCDQGLFCLCPASAACSTGPARGMCVSECSSGFCDAGQECAGLLTVPTPSAGAEPWQKSLCLPACEKNTDCADGLRCRTLPFGPAGSAWVHACFADVPRDVGEPCADAGGNLRDDLCASGQCVDLGALGMCSLNCLNGSCPPGSDCAVFGDGRKLCLRPCTSYACASDALLTCVIPSLGDLGYHLASPSSPNAASTYCAPKFCTSDGDCLPNGTCLAQTAGPGRCVRR